MKKIIKEKLISGLLKEGAGKDILLEELSFLIEREIQVGQSLEKKLNNVNKPYADKLLNFLKSNNISDNANIDSIDYSEDDDKTLTAYSKDKEGNIKGRKYKVGKLLNYLGLKLDEFKGYELEDLISHLKRGTIEDFKLVDGKDILWAYHCDNYDEGETMGSCMRYESAQSYLKIYTENPDSVKCLVLINPLNNKVRGRALIWHTDADRFFMDKVYLTNNQYRNLFLQYAEQHGYETRTRSTVTLENADFDEYPFMDTFEYLNKDDNTLMTDNDRDESTVRLNDTGGNANSAGEYIELGSHAGETVDEDEAYYLSYRTPYGYVEGFAHQDDVFSYNDGDYLDEDGIRLVNGDFVFKYDEDNAYIEITQGDYSGRYGDIDNTIMLNVDYYGDDEWAYNDRDVVQLYGEKYGDDDNPYALKEDTVPLFDNKYGEGEYAFHKDSTRVVLKDYGYVWVLTDDLNDLGDYEILRQESFNNKTKKLIKELTRDKLLKLTENVINDDELINIAKWGLTGEYSTSGCWDDNDDDLDSAIECAVGDFKQALNKPYPIELGNIPDQPIIYRLVNLENVNDLDKENLGYSWFSNIKLIESPEFYQLLPHLKQHDKVYILKGVTSKDNIDMSRTLWERSIQWFENEIVIKDPKQIKLIEIKKK